MYKKVLYNIKKMKKCGGGGRGEGQYLNTKHFDLKKKNKKKKKKKLKKN